MLKGLFRSNDADNIIARSKNDLATKTEFALQTWGLGKGDRWDADLDAGTITFTLQDGVIAVAPVQVVGTYNTLDGTWLWGWDHPSVDEHLARDARKARDFGQEHDLSSLHRAKDFLQ